MKVKPAAVTSAIQALTALAGKHGLEAVNVAYAETVAAFMASREHDAWIAKIADGQREMALIEGY